MSVSAEFKNAAVFHALSERFEGAEFAFTPGLGISGAVWQRYGSKPLATRQAVAAGETASTETPFLSVVQCGEVRYVFVTSIKRLKLRSDATVTRVPLAGGR